MPILPMPLKWGSLIVHVYMFFALMQFFFSLF